MGCGCDEDGGCGGIFFFGGGGGWQTVCVDNVGVGERQQVVEYQCSKTYQNVLRANSDRQADRQADRHAYASQ